MLMVSKDTWMFELTIIGDDGDDHFIRGRRASPSISTAITTK